MYSQIETSFSLTTWITFGKRFHGRIVFSLREGNQSFVPHASQSWTKLCLQGFRGQAAVSPRQGNFHLAEGKSQAKGIAVSCHLSTQMQGMGTLSVKVGNQSGVSTTSIRVYHIHHSDALAFHIKFTLSKHFFELLFTISGETFKRRLAGTYSELCCYS